MEPSVEPIDIFTRFANAHLVFRLPIPPSANNLHIPVVVRGKRPKSRQYVAWEKHADQWYMLQQLSLRKKLPGKYTVDILLPQTRGDPDNRIKPVLDWMVSRDLTADDAHCTRVTARVDEGLESKRECWVAISKAP